MSIQIFGTKKCKKTAKAVRFFKERGIQIHQVDLVEKGISQGELDSVIQSAGIDELIDTNSKAYKAKGMSYMEYDPIEEILENPLILNTPIVRRGKTSIVGERPSEWKDLAALEK